MNRNISLGEISDRTSILSSEVQERISQKKLRNYADNFDLFLEAKKKKSLEHGIDRLTEFLNSENPDTVMKAIDLLSKLKTKKYPWQR